MFRAAVAVAGTPGKKFTAGKVPAKKDARPAFAA